MSVLQGWKVFILLSALWPLSSSFTPSSSTWTTNPLSSQVGPSPFSQSTVSTVSLQAAGKKRKRRRRKDQSTASAPEPEPVAVPEPSQQVQLDASIDVQETTPAEEVTPEDFSLIKDVANFEFESDGPAAIGMFHLLD